MLKQILSWSWVKNSLQGANNTASSRRLTTFWFVVLNTLNTFSIIVLAYVIATTPRLANDKSIEALEKLITLEFILCGMVLLLAAIITVEKLNDLTRTIKGLPPQPIEVTTTTETKSVVTPQTPE